MKDSSASGYVFAGVTRWQRGTQNGLFRMTVGDGRWERMSQGLPEDAYVMCITVDPVDRARIFIGTQHGVYRSTDYGTRWTKLALPEPDAHIWSIALHPTRPGTVLAGASPVGVFRSDDGGERWRRMPGSAVPDRLRMGAFVNRVMRMAVNPVEPDEMFAVLEVNGVMRSRDGGETWRDCNDDLLRLAEQPHLKSKVLTDYEQEGILDLHAVCMTAAAPGALFIAGRLGIFLSEDGAETWRDLEVGRFSPLTYARDIRVSPHDPRTLYATLSVAASGATGTLYRSADLGASWARLDHSIEADSTMMAIALDPRDASVIHCATRSGQVFGTHDGGVTWKECPLPEGSLGTYALAAA